MKSMIRSMAVVRMAAASVLLGLSALAVPAGKAAAQSGSYIGGRFGYQFDIEEVSVGAQFGIPITRNIDFYPSFDNYLVDGYNLWAFNLDLKINDPNSNLYGGGGVNFLTRSGGGIPKRTDKGVNLFGGFESRSGSTRPFVEGRVTIDDGATFQLNVGLNFRLGR